MSDKKFTYEGKRIIPDSITSANLLSGAVSIYFSSQGKIDLAFMMILIGAFFDFFDGFAARLLKVGSDFGIQLDSLADCVTFGLAPSFLLLHFSIGISKCQIFWFIPLIIAVFSALRLAKFNIDKRQTTSFIGLPTPANSIFIGSIAYLSFQGSPLYQFITDNILYISVLSVVSSYLLISEISFFSLKLKTIKIKENPEVYILLLSAIVLFLIFNEVAIPLIMLSYIFISVLKNFIK